MRHLWAVPPLGSLKAQSARCLDEAPPEPALCPATAVGLGALSLVMSAELQPVIVSTGVGIRSLFEGGGMDSDSRVYVEFSPDLKARLNNRVSLEDILAEAGVDADIEWHAVPPTDPEARGKNLVETANCISMGALGLAVAVKIIESAISSWLDRKAVRDSHFGEWVNEPALDGKGRPILDPKGKPLQTRRRVSGFDELPAAHSGSVTISVGLKGLSASIGGDQGSPGRGGATAAKG